MWWEGNGYTKEGTKTAFRHPSENPANGSKKMANTVEQRPDWMQPLNPD